MSEIVLLKALVGGSELDKNSCQEPTVDRKMH
jgi:hypothetical protein